MRRFDSTSTPDPVLVPPTKRSIALGPVGPLGPMPQIAFLQRRIQDMVEETLADVGQQTLLACAVAWHRQGVALDDLVRETGVPLDVLTAAVQATKPKGGRPPGKAKALKPTRVTLVTPPATPMPLPAKSAKSTKSTKSRRAKRRGRPPGSRADAPRRGSKVAKALTRIKRGMSIRAAAEAVGISPQAVSQARARWLPA